jgi:hypothetical protein
MDDESGTRSLQHVMRWGKQGNPPQQAELRTITAVTGTPPGGLNAPLLLELRLAAKNELAAVGGMQEPTWRQRASALPAVRYRSNLSAARDVAWRHGATSLRGTKGRGGVRRVRRVTAVRGAAMAQGKCTVPVGNKLWSGAASGGVEAQPAVCYCTASSGSIRHAGLDTPPG